MNNYKFIHEDIGVSKTTTTLRGQDQAEDVIKAFYYFLLGLGYSVSSLTVAFGNIAEEYKGD